VTLTRSKSKIPSGVWTLGFVSLFMDMSSEMIHALLPLYLTAGLGISVMMVGIIEGAAEATAQIVKVFSGVLSDRWQSRKGLTLLGYGLAALTKPVFPLASSASLIFAARIVDRIGKGIRGAPRDALVADMTAPEIRGAAFGLRQSLDTVGAFAGPLIAVGLMYALSSDIRAVFWYATIPALLAVLLLAIGVKEPAVHADAEKKPGFNLATVKSMPPLFWAFVALASFIMLARFSEAFLVLKASFDGLAPMYVPMVMIVMSLVYSLSAYPAGILSDRTGRKGLLTASLAALIAANLVLGFNNSAGALFGGVALWGLHMGLSQGILSSLGADHAPAHLRGTAFGVFNLATGLTSLLASILAGIVWTQYGPAMTFHVSAGISVLALLAVMTTRLENGNAKPAPAKPERADIS
jgi:MFS family permease